MFADSRSSLGALTDSGRSRGRSKVLRYRETPSAEADKVFWDSVRRSKIGLTIPHSVLFRADKLIIVIDA